MNLAVLRRSRSFFMGVRSLAHVACAAVLACVLTASAVDAEDDGFAPPDTRPTKAEAKPRESKVYSFGRFETPLREICREMELDGRRTKLVQLSEVERKGNPDCASCRALWKSIYWACRDSAILDTKDASKGKKKKLEQSKERPETDGAAEQAPPEPTATPKPLQRYPTTAMLDLTSRLSVSLYNQDPGTGGYYKALQSFADTLTRHPSLTPGERDYYAVFVSFLMASWVDRENLTTHETGTEKQDLSSMFE